MFLYYLFVFLFFWRGNPSEIIEDSGLYENDVLQLLLKLDCKKPVDISSNFLKTFAHEIHKSVCYLFNTSLCTEVGPSQWRKTNVELPVHTTKYIFVYS